MIKRILRNRFSVQCRRSKRRLKRFSRCIGSRFIRRRLPANSTVRRRSITVPDWVVQASFLREVFSVQMGPQNRRYPIIQFCFQRKKNKPKGNISCITVRVHLSCIHVSVLFISTIGLVRKSRKLLHASINHFKECWGYMEIERNSASLLYQFRSILLGY